MIPNTNVPATTEEAPKNTKKRDQLIEIEHAMQTIWNEAHAFECDPFSYVADGSKDDLKDRKYYATIPYPYMNGRLHLGHSFSLSKVEFAIGFERLRGKIALWPLGFHCTGQPIKACADKLVREVALYGSKFDATEEEVSRKLAEASIANGSPNVQSSMPQWRIMESIGVPRDEIAEFVDPNKWLYYFPPLAQQDASRMGFKIDWRRSFITTDVNPYYDSFVRWQFNKLHILRKIKFGERYTIWSPRDCEPCMDHDRASGEGVGPIEYTLIKIEILKPNEQEDQSPASKNASLKAVYASNSNARIYLVAATLRPETMYGQTNCYVSPTITYGIYQTKTTDQIFICSSRSALNMSFQNTVFSKKGCPNKIGTVLGIELVGLRVRAPLASFPHVYVLPMDSIIATKGTGVVTSVPADSPDDFVMLRDLKKKPDYYKIDPSWVAGFDPVPVLTTPAYGEMSAPKIVELLKINSPKERINLDKAKEMAYKEGFYNGVMSVGDFKGKPVAQAKVLIRNNLIKCGEALAYAEPEREVISRSGDICVVNLFDQWYLDYGEQEWREKTQKALDNIETYHPEIRNQFQKTLEWLNKWACARSFGLGTKLPWDNKFIVESLSDSTIYMAYYTVCHMLHSDLYGKVRGTLDIGAVDMNDSCWEFIFNERAEYPDSADALFREKLDKMRKEFLFFYPMDLRVSGKDLVSNHLTFMLYNHTCLFDEHLWPKGIRVNGLLLLNSEKMSKSTGNFLTMADALAKYGADATRMTLADAGDSTDDANFVEAMANAAILRLHTLLQWIIDVTSPECLAKMRDVATPDDITSEKNRTENWLYLDHVFYNKMLACVNLSYTAYDGMLYREALKTGFFEMQEARDIYRENTQLQGVGMARQLISQFIEWQILALTPICPHLCEYVWNTVLKKPESLMKSGKWPQCKKANISYLNGADYVKDLMYALRTSETLMAKKNKKKTQDNTTCLTTLDAEKKIKRVGTVFIAGRFPDWQETAISAVREIFKTKGMEAFSPASLRETGLLSDKRVMPLVMSIRRSVEEMGESGFERGLDFEEYEVAMQCRELVRKSLNLDELNIFKSDEPTISQEHKSTADLAAPGKPITKFALVSE